MSNTRHLPPSAPVPASPDVAERTLAQLIGASVAIEAGNLFGPVLQQIAALQQQIASQARAECFFCVLTAKALVRDYQAAVANAQAAAEPNPEPPPPPQVNTGITQVIVTQLANTPAGLVPTGGSVWACWEHVELPAQPPRQTGLVRPDGSPIIKA